MLPDQDEMCSGPPSPPPVDTEPPVITVIPGPNNEMITQGLLYVDAGATAFDNVRQLETSGTLMLFGANRVLMVQLAG